MFLTNTVDKIKQLEDENLRFSFPLNVEDGSWSLDIPYSVLHPDKNQIAGANKNFFCPQRFIDLSNATRGITLANVDAPLAEIGEMYGQDWMKDMTERPWLMHLPQSTRLFSWVMNNAWFVNYKGFQEGRIAFRYVIKPHGGFIASDAKRFGVETTTPLLAFTGDHRPDLASAPVSIKGASHTMVQALKPVRDGNGYLIRLFNASGAPETITVKFSGSGTLYRSNGKEEPLEEIEPGITIDAWDVVTLRYDKA